MANWPLASYNWLATTTTKKKKVEDDAIAAVDLLCFVGLEGHFGPKKWSLTLLAVAIQGARLGCSLLQCYYTVAQMVQRSHAGALSL